MINDRESQKIRHIGGGTPPQPLRREPPRAPDEIPPAPGGPEPNGAAARPAPRKRKKRKAGRIALIAFIVLALAGAGYGVKVYYDVAHPASLFQAGSVPGAFAQATPGGGDDASSGSADLRLLSEADLAFMKNRVSILTLGLDKSTVREDWGSFRTDTMILVTIDFTTKNVDMISIPRDSYVKLVNARGAVIKSGGDAVFGKINSAFPTGGGSDKDGYAYAMNTVSYLMGGIPIRYYLGFDMNVVEDVVNAMGGVDYNVDTEVDLDGVVLHPGMQHLNGVQVLQYARQRKGSSDIARVERQQKILTAIFQQLKKTGNIVKLPQLYGAVSKNIETNLTTEQIASLALLATNMKTSQLNRHTVEGDFLDLDSGSYWGVNTAKLKDLIKQVFGIDVKIDGDISVSKAEARAETGSKSAVDTQELSTARAAARKAKGILDDYGAWLTDAARSQLESALDALNDAIDSKDSDQMAACTPPVENLCAIILEQLQQYGQATPSPEEGDPEDATPAPEGTPAAASPPPSPIPTVHVPEMTPAPSPAA